MNILNPLAAMAIFMAGLCDPVSAQANDNFASRTVVASAGGAASGSNLNATREAGEPNHAGDEGGGSVWWTWTPAVSGTAEITTSGSDFDTVLGVYTGTSVAALTERASNDDGVAGTTSRVIFSVTAGTAYQIAVDGYGGASGSISLTVFSLFAVATSASPATGGTTDGGGTFTSGASATVTATAAPSYAIVNWTEVGAQVSSSASYTFKVNENRTLVANFERVYVVTTRPSPGVGGTVSGGGTYANGKSATVTAMAASGYSFVNWTENGVPVNNEANYTFTVDANRTLVANFRVELVGPDTYGIKRLDVGRGELVFTEVPGARSYRVEWSATMALGSWSREAPGVSLIPAMGPGDRTVRIGFSRSPCFYRVVAEMVPFAPQGFVFIPAGRFLMGNVNWPEGDGDETPVDLIDVSAFYLQELETTKGEWDAVRTWALANGYKFDQPGQGKGADHPVVDVTWDDVVKWCNARSQREGLVPCYYTNAARTQVYKTGVVELANDHVLWTANGYRLPTEAEWEKAARGGLAGKRFPWGDTITHSLANYYSDSFFTSEYDTSPTRGYHPLYNIGGLPRTSPVGSFAPNGYGLYDMAGNVWEWCWDWHDYYTSGATTDPRGPSSSRWEARVSRGGSWASGAGGCRVTVRLGRDPSYGSDNSGFRLARGR